MRARRAEARPAILPGPRWPGEPERRALACVLAVPDAGSGDLGQGTRRDQSVMGGTFHGAAGTDSRTTNRSTPCDAVRFSRHNFCITLGKTFGDRGIGRHA